MVIRSGKRKVRIEGNLPVIYFREGDAIIAYSPALDLSSYGASLDEAKKNFNEVLDLFFEDLIQRGTLEDVLEECGWKKVQKPVIHWIPPAFICQELISLASHN